MKEKCTNPIVSIILPIYNVERFLLDCLESIQHQTYQNFEVIMVDDGSTDSSAEIAQKFVEKDNRFKLYHQKNAGQSAARNKGLTLAQGEYLTFVDSDDVLHHRFLERCLDVMTDDIDIVEVRVQQFTANLPNLIKEESNPRIHIYQGKYETVPAVVNANLGTGPYAKLFRKELMSDLVFPVGYIYEDFPVIMNLCKEGYTFKKIEMIGYFYRKGHISTLGSSFNEKDWDLFTVCKQIEENFKEEKELLPYIYNLLAGNILYQFLYKTNFRTKARNSHKKMIKEYGRKACSKGKNLKIAMISPNVAYILAKLKTGFRKIKRS